MASSASSSESEDAFDISEARTMVTTMNRKRKKPGGFQAMGLSDFIFKGVSRKGYKVPTPIQRKAIPVIISGRDVVAMARTGSGKTAAFLIPLFEKFQCHSSSGPRALIMSPTRELAIQTLKFAKELGKFTTLTATIILGGDKMEEQFSALHKNPDIIIATPGRFLHVMMEMNLSLKTIEYVVFDEGDRLFELGFAEQLSETLKRLPRMRQTLIFSATLPQSLIEFARAGLSDPVLIRLDVDTKLSENLKLAYISCLPDEKEAILVHTLSHVIPSDQQVVIFFATKHHVEFFHMLLSDLGFNCVLIHSGLDPMARNSAVKQFRSRKVRLLLVTDVAARGVDIPELDNVLNYHFPGQAKLFLHRVGRVARAGRSGFAYSLVDPDELPYLLDVFVFLGKKWQPSEPTANKGQWISDCIGRAPRSLGTVVATRIQQTISQNASLVVLKNSCGNAMKKYIQTRPKASSESVRRAKELRDYHTLLPVHHLFDGTADEENATNNQVLAVIRGLKLPTIFEALGKQANPSAYATMAKKRHLHDQFIARHSVKAAESEKHLELKSLLERTVDLSTKVGTVTGDGDMPEDLENTEFFIPYSRGNEARERGLAIGNSSSHFNLQASAASMDIQGDEPSRMNNVSRSKSLIWDRKKKRYMSADAIEGKANMKRIKTESGVWIPASYKTDKYERWLKQSKSDLVEQSDQMAASEEPNENPKSGRTMFSTKFGSVIEFPDTTGHGEDDQGGSKEKHFRPNRTKSRNKNSKMDKVTKPGFSVIGPQKWYERATMRQQQRSETAENKQTIRQPKGGRTFGQLRKPEQILKQRRQREKMKNKANPKSKGGKPGKVQSKKGKPFNKRSK